MRGHRALRTPRRADPRKALKEEVGEPLSASSLFGRILLWSLRPVPEGPPGLVSRNLSRAASGSVSGWCSGPTAVCGVVKRFCRALVVWRDWWGAIRPVPSPLTRDGRADAHERLMAGTVVVGVAVGRCVGPGRMAREGLWQGRVGSGGRGVGAREIWLTPALPGVVRVRGCACGTCGGGSASGPGEENLLGVVPFGRGGRNRGWGLPVLLSKGAHRYAASFTSGVAQSASWSRARVPRRGACWAWGVASSGYRGVGLGRGAVRRQG
jgi:hypothetical protein